MTVKRLGDEGPARSRFAGAAAFLMPDGQHFRAHCEARFTRERWRGTLTLVAFGRGLERGDVCRLMSDRLGDLRIIILDKVGTHRYEFIALVKPDPYEGL